MNRNGPNAFQLTYRSDYPHRDVSRGSSLLPVTTQAGASPSLPDSRELHSQTAQPKLPGDDSPPGSHRPEQDSPHPQDLQGERSVSQRPSCPLEYAIVGA